MSAIYPDLSVEYIEVTLKSRVSGAAPDLDIVAGTEYYHEGELFSGSPEVLPLLTVGPQVISSIGDQIGIRHDITISLYPRCPIRYNLGLIDYRDVYEFYRAVITVKYGTKSRHKQGVSADFVTKQEVEIVDSAWTETELVFTCRDVWFEDKEVSQRIPDPADIPAFSNTRPDYIGEYGSWAFGQDQIIDAPLYDATPTSAEFTLFGGWNIGSQNMRELKTFYVENPTPDLSNLRFLEIDNPTQPLYGANMSTFGQTGGSYFHLGQFWRSCEITTDDNQLLSTVQIDMSKVGTPVAGSGELRMQLYRGVYLASSNTVVPDGPVLASRSIDPLLFTNTAPTHATNVIGWETPVALVGKALYVIVFTYSNNTDTTNYIAMSVLGGTADDHYSLDRSVQDNGWTLQTGIRLACTPYGYDTIVNQTASSGGYRWNRAVIIDPNPVIAGVVFPNPGTTLEYKLRVDGLEDTATGTYTGTADALMERPADLVNFFLQQFALVPSTDIDTTSFENARDSQATESFVFGFVIDSETYTQELVIDILKQSRTVLYREPGGDYKLYFYEPSEASGSTDNEFHEHELQDELFVEQIADEPINRVFNDFEQPWDPDPIQTPKDPDLIRRTGSDKYKKIQFLNGVDSTASDATREAKMAHSETLYGKRRLVFPLDKHENATGVQNLQNYFADRFHLRHQVVTFRVPRRLYYKDVGLLDSGEVTSTDIGETDGHFVLDKARTIGTNTVSALVPNYPDTGWNFGALKGRITGITEQGPWMIVSITTDDGPGSY